MAPRPHLRDEAHVGSLVAVTSGYEPTQAYTYGAALRCRFLRVATTELVDGAVRKATGVSIHFPAGTVIDSNSRIKLTKRNRATLGTVEYYDVTGEPWATESNRTIVCDCTSVPVGAE